MDGFWKDFGNQMDCFWWQQSYQKSMFSLGRFWEAYVNIDGAASRLRVSCEGGCDLCTFGGRCPLGAPLYQRLQYYNTPKHHLHIGNKTMQLLWRHALGRWPGEFSTSVRPHQPTPPPHMVPHMYLSWNWWRLSFGEIQILFGFAWNLFQRCNCSRLCLMYTKNGECPWSVTLVRRCVVVRCIYISTYLTHISTCIQVYTYIYTYRLFYSSP